MVRDPGIGTPTCVVIVGHQTSVAANYVVIDHDWRRLHCQVQYFFGAEKRNR